MRVVWAILLICLATAPPALAGAWLREQGTGFVSIGGTLRWGDPYLQYDTKAFAEYGLRPRLTVGLDMHNNPEIAGHAIAFLRFPLGDPQGRTRYSLEIGAGAHHVENQWQPMYKTALAVGRGFETRWGNGWMGAEAAIELRQGLPDPIYKLDAVAGLSSGMKFRPLLKLESYSSGGREIGWAVTPGLMYETKKGATWVVGVKRDSVTQSGVGLTLDLWRNF